MTDILSSAPLWAKTLIMVGTAVAVLIVLMGGGAINVTRAQARRSTQKEVRVRISWYGLRRLMPLGKRPHKPETEIKPPAE